MKTKVIFKVIVATAFICLGVSACTFGEEEKPMAEVYVNVGDTLPSVKVRQEDGTMLSTDTLIGKTRIMLVWHSLTCSDCQRLMPVIDEYIKKYADKQKVKVIKAEREKNISAYLKFANRIVPRVFVTDKSGIVISSFDDSRNLKVEDFASIFE